VINAARERWRLEQERLREFGGTVWLEDWDKRPVKPESGTVRQLTEEQIHRAIDDKVAQKIAEHIEQRRLRPETLPADDANLAGTVAALLKQAGDFDLERPPTGTPDRTFPYSFIVRRRLAANGSEFRTGIRFLGSGSAKSTAAALRWLKHANPLLEQTLLVTDQRCPLVFGAQPDAKSRKYYEELRGREPKFFRHIELTFEDYVQLDALQAVVGMARSGDIEIDVPGAAPRRVGEQEVIESHGRQGRYLALPFRGVTP
jgi:hypothetical protein